MATPALSWETEIQESLDSGGHLTWTMQHSSNDKTRDPA